MKRNETAAHYLHAAVIILLDVNKNRGRVDEREKLGKAEAHLKRADKILSSLPDDPQPVADGDGALPPAA